MDEIDAIVQGIMQEMRCDPSKPPHWVSYEHRCVDQRTGEVYRKMENGYVCSRCGKHSWTKKEKCDGCNSIMQKEE